MIQLQLEILALIWVCDLVVISPLKSFLRFAQNGF